MFLQHYEIESTEWRIIFFIAMRQQFLLTPKKDNDYISYTTEFAIHNSPTQQLTELYIKAHDNDLTISL